MSSILNQAIATHQRGDFAEAEKLYREALKVDPRQADALALLGVVLGAKGSYDEALRLVTQAVEIDPQSALFHFHRGSVQMAMKMLSEAVESFQRALALQPQFPQAYYNLANALRADNRWPEAINAYRAALQQQPDYAEAYNNLALSLVHEKQFDEALAAAKKSVEYNPTYGEGWRTLCNIAEQAKDYALALQAGERCVALMPESHFSWFGYGVALNRADRNEEAIEAYKRALVLKPERADIWDNLGQTYQSLNWLEEAEATYRKCIEVAGQTIADEDTRAVAEEEYGNRHWHLALLELLRGKLKPGFARYRSRFKDVGGLKRPNFSRPLWKGEDINGKTVLVTDEQGFGDTLMLCRYLPLMKQRGAKIIFSMHKVLQPLFENWDGKDILITHGEVAPPYDYYASVFDLPHIFGTMLETIPAQVPYLPLLSSDEATQLLGDGRKKIGVVWGGSPAHGNDTRRSVPLKIFSTLFQKKQFQFFSLNRDMKTGDAELLPQLPVTDLAPRIRNFADGARLVMQMDLIITCDTATAHLGGGLGKPVWVLLPFAPDWRWLTERRDNPWYPNVRLFRQPKISDWAGAVYQVAKALEAGI
jgi:tetratricopeptide (TPR) repeat protein